MSISRLFQLTLFQLTQWWAFLHFLFVMTFIPMVILTSKRGMFEDDPSLYELFVGIYGNFLALLPGGEIVWGLALSPALWLVLWITTGRARILPWRK